MGREATHGGVWGGARRPDLERIISMGLASAGGTD